MSTSTHHIEELLSHARWMEQFARRLCADGNDLVQEAWITTLQAPAPRPEQERAWLATVMRNAQRMRLRGARRRKAREEVAPDHRSHATPETLVQRVQVQRRLCEHLLALDERHREAVLLHFVEGLSVAEIGRRSGLSARTVHSRITRGLELLRESLDEESGGDRQAWRLAMAPIFLPSIEGASAGSASALLGGLAMKAKSHIALLILLLLCAAGGVVASFAFNGAESETSARAASTWRGAGALQAGPRAGASDESCTLRGIVTDESGAAIALARIAVQDVGRPRVVVTDGEGRFELAGVPANLKRLGVAAPGYAGAMQSLDGACQEPLAIELVRGGSRVEGSVRDLGGGPVAGALVGLRALDSLFDLSSQGARGMMPSLSDEEGHFELWVAPGAYEVSVMHEAYVDHSDTLGVGPQAMQYEVELAPAGTMRGRVIDEARGSPVANATLEIYGDAMTRPRKSAASDAQGNFEVEGLAPGRIHIAAHTDTLATWADVEVDLRLAEDVAGVVVAMRRAFTVRGSLVEEGSGKPVEGGVVVLTSVQAANRVSAESETGADGSFEIRGVPPGHYRPQALARGYVSELRFDGKHIEIQGQDLDQQRLELKRGRVVRGRLHPARRARIVFESASSDKVLPMSMLAAVFHPAESDARGFFELHDLPEERVLIRATSEDGLVGSVELAGDQSEVAIELDAGPSLSGRVVDASGSPVSGAWLSVHGPGARVEALRTELGLGPRTDADGHFELSGLQAGPYQLRVFDASGERPLASGEDGSVELDASHRGITLRVAPRGARITGLLVDEEGAPVADAWVEAERIDDDKLSPFQRQRIKRVLSGQDGRFAFEDLVEGDYEVLARFGSFEGDKVRTHSDQEMRLTVTRSLAVHVDAKGARAGETCTIRTRGPTLLRSARTVGAIDLSLRPGDYDLGLECPTGFGRYQGPITGAPVSVEILAYGRIRAHLRDAQGGPAAGARVLIPGRDFREGVGDYFVDASSADAQGDVVIDKVWPGALTLYFLLENEAGETQSATRDIELGAGENLDLGELRLQESAVVREE